MEDWSDEPPQKGPRPTLRPVFVAALIVVACVALAVWTLQNTMTPPVPAPVEVEATPTPAPTARKERPLGPSPTPRPADPTPTPAPARAATSAAAATLTPTPTATPRPTASPTAVPTARKREEASLRTVAPPKVKRGSSTVLDVRGRALRPDHRVIVLRGGRVPADIGVPRQKLVDPTLIQVLVVIGAQAAKGEYDVAVADGDGRRSNRVHFEVIP